MTGEDKEFEYSVRRRGWTPWNMNEKEVEQEKKRSIDVLNKEVKETRNESIRETEGTRHIDINILGRG